MKTRFRTLAVLFAVALIAPLALAGDFEPGDDGPWVNVDVIDLVDYGDATYLEFLGSGYVAMLEALKTEGLILDYGVMMKTTGNTNDGDVMIWWSVPSLAGYEKALERMGELTGEMRSAEEWQAMWSKMAELRTIRSSNLYRAVTWKEKSAE
jgi:hypothetical protein